MAYARRHGGALSGPFRVSQQPDLRHALGACLAYGFGSAIGTAVIHENGLERVTSRQRGMYLASEGEHVVLLVTNGYHYGDDGRYGCGLRSGVCQSEPLRLVFAVGRRCRGRRVG